MLFLPTVFLVLKSTVSEAAKEFLKKQIHHIQAMGILLNFGLRC